MKKNYNSLWVGDISNLSKRQCRKIVVLFNKGELKKVVHDIDMWYRGVTEHGERFIRSCRKHLNRRYL